MRLSEIFKRQIGPHKKNPVNLVITRNDLVVKKKISSKRVNYLVSEKNIYNYEQRSHYYELIIS